MDKTIKEIDVRGKKLNLSVFNRSLDLCSRMNYETENLDFIDMMKPGEVMYDLGACEGRFSVYAGLNDIKTYSFEPDKDNFTVLQENVALNNLSGTIIPYNVAIGRSTEERNLKIGQPWAGGHQKVVDYGETRVDLDFDFKQTEKIKVVSLDDFIASNSIEHPDYLKVDIDGSEMPFLDGAKKSLDNPKLKCIIFELSKADPNYETIINRLAMHGFEQDAAYQVPNEPNLYNIVFKRKN